MESEKEISDTSFPDFEDSLIPSRAVEDDQTVWERGLKCRPRGTVRGEEVTARGEMLTTGYMCVIDTLPRCSLA